MEDVLGTLWESVHFFSTQGNKSLVDYTLVDDSFFKNLDSLIVKPLSYLSGHCQVVTSIKFN